MSSMNIMLWNQKDLPRPPINTYKALKGDLDLFKLRNTLQDGITHFKDDEFLTNEAAILSRMLYRLKTKFRSSKDFKLMEKLNRSLRIYFKTNVGRDLKNILEMTPTRYEADTYLPTKNILQYVLVRLQGLAKLMERMYDMCLIIASELNQRIYIGHFWKILLLLFAVISRISALVKFNTNVICDLYGKLLPYSYKLINTGKNWLPKEYDLPSDLRAWLSVQWVYEDDFVDLTYEPTNKIIDFFNLIDDDDDDDVLFCNEYVLLDDDDGDKQIAHDFKKLSPLKDIITKNRMRGFSINEDDIGEEITDAIELNDSVHPKMTEEDTECKLNDVEDFGEEILATNDNNTTFQKISNNKCTSNANEKNENCSEDDVSNNDNMNIEDSVIIVLDKSIVDTKLQKSIKKKKKIKSNKSQDSFKEIVEVRGQTSQKKKKNKQHNGESTKIPIKRKLQFDEHISNKKLKTVNEDVSGAPTKRKKIKTHDSDIDNNNEAAKKKVNDNDAMKIEKNRHVIVLDDSIVDKNVQNTNKKKIKVKKNKSQVDCKETVKSKHLKSPEKMINKEPKEENSNNKLETLVNISANDVIVLDETIVDKKVQNTDKKRIKAKKNKSRDALKENVRAKDFKSPEKNPKGPKQENSNKKLKTLVYALNNSASVIVYKKVRKTKKKRKKSKKNKLFKETAERKDRPKRNKTNNLMKPI